MDRILEEVQNGDFDPIKMFTGNKDKFLEVKSAIESISNNLPKEVCIKFIITKIVPTVFNKNVDNSVRDEAVEVGLHFLQFVNISTLDTKEQEDVFVSMEQTYTKFIGDLRDTNYPNWDKLWIFLIKLCAEKLHIRMGLANKLLRVVEVAFRNSTSIEQRLKAYDCWVELINNSSLNMEHMCSPKQIKLLMTPLKAKFSRIPIVIMKRCDTFLYLLEKLQDKASLCLREFLEFCFGPFDEKNDVEKMRQGRSVPEVCNKSTKVLLKIIGHSHGIEDNCLIDDDLLLFTPLINDDNFPEFVEILINSVVECCKLVSEWSEDASMNIMIIKCLWQSLLRLVRNSKDDIKKKSCTIINNCLKKLSERSQNDEHLPTILGNIVSLLIEDEVVGKLKDVLFDVGMNLISRTFAKSCTFNMENILNFVVSCFDLENGSKFDKIASIFFKNDIKCNSSLMCDVWLKCKITIVPDSISTIVWPIRHFKNFNDVEALNIKWTKIYNDNKSDSVKGTLMQEMEKLFLENPLLGSNVVHFLQILSSTETNSGKDFVAKFMRLIELVLTLPNLPEPDIKKLSSVVITYCNQNQQFYKSESIDEALDKLCGCLEHLITIHKDYTILTELTSSLKNAQPKILFKFSKRLMSLLETLMLNEDNAIANSTRKLIELLETKENEPGKAIPLTNSSRSLRIVNMVNVTPKSKKPVGSTYNLSTFGKKSDKSSSPLSLKGKFSSSRDKSYSKDKHKNQKESLSLNDDKSSDYVKIDTKVKIDINNLSEHQKEMLKKRREDIPALYEDLTQSQSQDTQEFLKKITDCKEDKISNEPTKTESPKKDQKKSSSPSKKRKRNDDDIENRRKSRKIPDESIHNKLEGLLETDDDKVAAKQPEESVEISENKDQKQPSTSEEILLESSLDIKDEKKDQNDVSNVISSDIPVISETEGSDKDGLTNENSVKQEDDVKEDDKKISSPRSKKKSSVKKSVINDETQINNENSTNEETQRRKQDSHIEKKDSDKEKDLKAKSRRRSSIKKIVWNDDSQIESQNDNTKEGHATKEISTEENNDKEIATKSEIELTCKKEDKQDIKENEVSPKSKKKASLKNSIPIDETQIDVQSSTDENVQIINEDFKDTKSEDSPKVKEEDLKDLPPKLKDESTSKPPSKPDESDNNEGEEQTKDDDSLTKVSELDDEDGMSTPTEEKPKSRRRNPAKRRYPRLNLPNRRRKNNAEKRLRDEIVSAVKSKFESSAAEVVRSTNISEDKVDENNEKKLDETTEQVKIEESISEENNENEIGSDILDKNEIDFETPLRKSKRQVKRHDYMDRLRAKRNPAKDKTESDQDMSSPNTVEKGSGRRRTLSAHRRRRSKPKMVVDDGEFEESIEDLLARVDKRIEERKQLERSLEEQRIKEEESPSAWLKPDLQDGNQNKIIPSEKQEVEETKQEDLIEEQKDKPQKGNRPIIKAKRHIQLSTKTLPITSIFQNTTERQLSFSKPDDVYEFKGEEESAVENLKKDKRRRKKSLAFNRSDYISKRRKRPKKETSVPFHITADSHLPLSRSQSLRAVSSEESETITILITRSPPESSKMNKDDPNNSDSNLFSFSDDSLSSSPKRKSKRKQSIEVRYSEDIIESSQDTPVADVNKRKSPKNKAKLKQTTIQESPKTILDSSVSKEDTLTLGSNSDEVIKSTLDSLKGSQEQEDTDDSLPDTLTLDVQEKIKNQEKRSSSLSPLLRKTGRRHSLNELSSQKPEPSKRIKRSASLDSLDRSREIDFTVKPKTSEESSGTDTQETEITDSEQIQQADTLTLSPVKTKDDLPGSPITCDTPDRTTEFLNNTFDISPISSAQEDEISTPIQKPSASEVSSLRVARLLRMVNSNVQVGNEGRRWFGNKHSSPSSSRVRKMRMKKEENLDILTFSREIPSPLTLPASGILKRKLNSLEDSPAPAPKRKRVNFSDPAITDKKIFLKDSEEYLNTDQTNETEDDDLQNSNDVKKSGEVSNDKDDSLFNFKGFSDFELKDVNNEKFKEIFKHIIQKVKVPELVEAITDCMSTSDSNTIEEITKSLLQKSNTEQIIEKCILPIIQNSEIVERIMPQLVEALKTISRENLEELLEEISQILGEEKVNNVHRKEVSNKQVKQHVMGLGCDKMNDLIKSYFTNLEDQKRNEFLVDLMNLASSELPVNKEFVNCHVNILQNFVRKMTD